MNLLPRATRDFYRVAIVAFLGMLMACLGCAESLAGKLVDRLGRPVAGGIVTALGTSTVPWTSASAFTARDGSFSFPHLDRGAYRFCVQVPAGGYLNPCEWSIAAPTTTIAPGSAVTGFQLKIDIGSVVKIEVDDPNNLTAPSGSSSAPAQLTIGVHAPSGLFEPAFFRSKDATGAYHFDVTIPFDTSINLEVLSGKLQVGTSSGAPLVGPTAVMQSSSVLTSPATLTFQILGVKP